MRVRHDGGDQDLLGKKYLSPRSAVISFQAPAVGVRLSTLESHEMKECSVHYNCRELFMVYPSELR